MGVWHTPDPLAEVNRRWSTYAYCADNPLRFIDPDGRRQWPINETYKGYKRTHSNNWGEQRRTHKHKGDDMNFKGAGDKDRGAPILTTHDGVVSSVKTIEGGDKNAGGTRITVTSEDGKVSTTYMHLSDVDVKKGQTVNEGQQIGEMGGTGYGKEGAYGSHLHYELKVDGKNVNPVGSDGKLIDPQKLIEPSEPVATVSASLPEVVVVGQAPKATQREIPLLEVPKKELPI